VHKLNTDGVVALQRVLEKTVQELGVCGVLHGFDTSVALMCCVVWGQRHMLYLSSATPDDPHKLTIGPYQGDGVIASGIIDFGKGVCGTAAETKVTQIVADVTKCDVRQSRSIPRRMVCLTHLLHCNCEQNYIACDLFTKSEIVVPVFDSEGKVCSCAACLTFLD